MRNAVVRALWLAAIAMALFVAACSSHHTSSSTPTSASTGEKSAWFASIVPTLADTQSAIDHVQFSAEQGNVADTVHYCREFLGDVEKLQAAPPFPDSHGQSLWSKTLDLDHKSAAECVAKDFKGASRDSAASEPYLNAFLAYLHQ